MARIELRHLRKTLGGGIEAVKDLALVIEEGEFLVLVGPSGYGKTTTLRRGAARRATGQGYPPVL